MGHSTVSFSRKGMLTRTEVLKAMQEKQSNDRDEYGYNQSPDSFAHAETPSFNHTHKVFSQSKVSEIIGRIESYSSICLYYIPDEVWNKHFKVNDKEIKKIETKINKVKIALEKSIAQAWDKSGMKQIVDEKNDTKSVFISCPKCSSKINAGLYLRSSRSAPHRCPVCAEDQGGQFVSMWRNKLFGKAHTNKRAKLEQEILSLQEQIKTLRAARISEMSVSELEKNKKLKNEVKTVVAADIHH